MIQVNPGNLASALKAVAFGHTTFALAPGVYQWPATYFAGPTSLELYCVQPGTVTLVDPCFVTRGMEVLAFNDMAFQWTPASAATAYKFYASGGSTWFNNCQGVNTGTGGFFQGKSGARLYIISGAGADSVWDFTKATLRDQFIDTEGGCHTHWMGAPAKGGLRNRVVFRLPTMAEASIHLAAGTAYLVDFAVEGSGPTGLRLCRGMNAAISTEPSNGEVGVVGFQKGILVEGGMLAINVGSSGNFVIRDCATGIELNGGLISLDPRYVQYPGCAAPLTNLVGQVAARAAA